MSIAIPEKVVVFDYGEVISIVPSERDRVHLLQLAGSEPAAFWAVYWRHRGALDQGTMGVMEYWRKIQQDLGADWDTALIHQLWLTDFRSWLAIDEGTLEVLIALQQGGTRMALLSNAGLDFASYYRHGMLGDLFEGVFVSGEIGVLKPSSEIYHALMKGLGVQAEEIIFVDDRTENVRSAEALGMRGHVFSTAERLRSFLEGVAAECAGSGRPSDALPSS
ncbi:HAD family hydrolase [Streptomyces chartreusis]|uniref:HAD family hydrolase n=1 Tax=Streptomyces chartreusis TaxID=1969 RepID=UPI00365407C2